MRSILVLISCIALAGVVQAEPQDNNQHKKKNAAQQQQTQAPQQHPGKGKHGLNAAGQLNPNAHTLRSQRHLEKLDNRNDLAAIKSNAKLERRARHFQLAKTPNLKVES